MYAALAVVSACWGRAANGGKGRVLDLDLVSSVFSLMEGMLTEHGLFGWVRQPQGWRVVSAHVSLMG